MLALGNPDLGNPKYDLKCAQDEVVAIAKDFPQAKVLIRKEATKTAFQDLGAAILLPTFCHPRAI